MYNIVLLRTKKKNCMSLNRLRTKLSSSPLSSSSFEVVFTPLSDRVLLFLLIFVFFFVLERTSDNVHLLCHSSCHPSLLQRFCELRFAWPTFACLPALFFWFWLLLSGIFKFCFQFAIWRVGCQKKKAGDRKSKNQRKFIRYVHPNN